MTHSQQETDKVSDLEKCARALNEARKSAGYPWFHEDPMQCEYSKHLARACLSALLTPSEGVVEAMRQCTIRNSRPVDPNRPFESPFAAALSHIIAQGEGR